MEFIQQVFGKKEKKTPQNLSLQDSTTLGQSETPLLTTKLVIITVHGCLFLMKIKIQTLPLKKSITLKLSLSGCFHMVKKKLNINDKKIRLKNSHKMLFSS